MAELLEALGVDLGSEALRETPRRVASTFAESAPRALPGDHLPNDGGYDELVVVSDIAFSSLCEHHLLPFSGFATRLPARRAHRRALKLPRLVEHRARRLQVQERLTTEVADWLERTLRPRAVGVVMEATHTCMSLRGVRQPGA